MHEILGITRGRARAQAERMLAEGVPGHLVRASLHLPPASAPHDPFGMDPRRPKATPVLQAVEVEDEPLPVMPRRAPITMIEHRVRAIAPQSQPAPAKRVGKRAIIEAAALVSGFPESAITGPCRSQKITTWRAAVGLIMRDRLRMSFPQIGRSLGGRDHSSVMHWDRVWWHGNTWRVDACEKAARRIEREMGLTDE